MKKCSLIRAVGLSAVLAIVSSTSHAQTSGGGFPEAGAGMQHHHHHHHCGGAGQGANVQAGEHTCGHHRGEYGQGGDEGYARPQASAN